MGKRLSTAVEVVVGILILALIGGIIAFVWKFSNGGTTDLATFYVECDGEYIINSATVPLKPNEKKTFYPKYVAEEVSSWFGGNKKNDSDEQKNKGYSVKIQPNITTETKFEYRVEKETYRFEKLKDKDFCNAFGFKKGENSFTLQIGEFSVADFIATQHSGKTVVLPDIFDETKVYFNLIVSSYDEKTNVVIGLTENKIINFTIDGKAYRAERDMTLEDWAASDLCTLDIKNGKLIAEGKEYSIFDKAQAGTMLTATTKLQEASNYFSLDYLYSISFSRVGVPSKMYAKQNMTWKEWVESDYNTGNLFLVNGKLSWRYEGLVYLVCYMEGTAPNHSVAISADDLVAFDTSCSLIILDTLDS